MSQTFWDFMWLILISFFLLAYLTVMFRIVVDLFRDEALNGVFKAIWLIALFVLPMLTALAYVIFRGRGMAERQHEDERRYRQSQEAYIREVAYTSPTDQIARARQLLQDGAITETEYGELKGQILNSLPKARAAGAAA